MPEESLSGESSSSGRLSGKLNKRISVSIRALATVNSVQRSSIPFSFASLTVLLVLFFVIPLFKPHNANVQKVDTYIASTTLASVSLAVVLRVFVFRLLGFSVHTLTSYVCFRVGATYCLFLSHCFEFNLSARRGLNPHVTNYSFYKV